MDDHNHVLNSHILPLPLLSEQRRYKLHVELPCLMIHHLGPHKRSNLPVISDVLHGSLLMTLLTFSMFFSAWTGDGQCECSQSFNQRVPTFFVSWNKCGVCAPHGIYTKICFEHFMPYWFNIPKLEVQFNANAVFLLVGH
jgi:hypothetical protein